MIKEGFQSAMGKPYNSGFTMVEMVLVMSLISLLTLIIGVPVILSQSDGFLNATDLQLKAMATYSTQSMNHTLSFNHRANINQAQSITFNNKRCVFQLGMGRYYCE